MCVYDSGVSAIKTLLLQRTIRFKIDVICLICPFCAVRFCYEMMISGNREIRTFRVEGQNHAIAGIIRQWHHAS
jgi:hypothetical protein